MVAVLTAVLHPAQMSNYAQIMISALVLGRADLIA